MKKPSKMLNFEIVLDGGAGELDRRDVSYPEWTDSDKAEAMIRDAVIDLASASILTAGDTIAIREVI